MPPRFQPVQAANQKPLYNEIIALQKLLGTVSSKLILLKTRIYIEREREVRISWNKPLESWTILLLLNKSEFTSHLALLTTSNMLF